MLIDILLTTVLGILIFFIIEFIIKRIDRSYSKISEFIYKIDELSLKKKKPINFKMKFQVCQKQAWQNLSHKDLIQN